MRNDWQSFFYLLGMGIVFLHLQCAEAKLSEDDFKFIRQNMIETQIKARGIQDERVLRAFEAVERHEFVPVDLRKYAYGDHPLAIGFGQTISQPYIVALMTEALQLEVGDKVLEVGTGSGYQAAVLAQIVENVYTIEIVEGLYQSATELLNQLGYHNIRTRLGDGWKGWPEESPFDKIIVTAAPDEIPQALLDQLRDGGRMVIPVGAQGAVQNLLIGVKENESFKTISEVPVRFVPLVRGHKEG